MFLSKLLSLRQPVFVPCCTGHELCSWHQAQGLDEVFSNLACASKAPSERLINCQTPFLVCYGEEVCVLLQRCADLISHVYSAGYGYVG